MLGDFPRLITLLRKERGITQKQASCDLGVSQALLSHYEKGIRECGLDFVVRIADYYGVSCDYLLGRTSDPHGMSKCGGECEKKPVQTDNADSRVLDAVDVVLSIADKTENEIIKEKSREYISLAVYDLYRRIHSSNPKNNDGVFSVPSDYYKSLVSAAMSVRECSMDKELKKTHGSGVPVITTTSLSEEFASRSVHLMDILRDSEKILDEFI